MPRTSGKAARRSRWENDNELVTRKAGQLQPVWSILVYHIRPLETDGIHTRFANCNNSFILQFLSSAGVEFLAAMDEAEKRKIPVVYGDRLVNAKCAIFLT